MDLEVLRKKGIDVDSALGLCIGSEEIYRDVLEAAIEEGAEKLPFLRECVEKEDYGRYCIEVHGLKNAAKQIGAGQLSEMAFEQEEAVKRGDYGMVKENYEAMLSRYQEVIGLLQDFFADEGKTNRTSVS